MFTIPDVLDPSRIIHVTIVGSKLYGFSNTDSDDDYFGIYVAPKRNILTLKGDTPQSLSFKYQGNDVVMHEIGKALRLLIKGNLSMIEGIEGIPAFESWYSPYVRVFVDNDIKPIRPHMFHCLGMTREQIKQFEKKPTIKAALHLFRAMFTGLYLDESNIFEFNLPLLAREFASERTTDLIQKRVNGMYHLGDLETAETLEELRMWQEVLEERSKMTRLPLAYSDEMVDSINEFLYELREDLG